jgi:death-on-curing protein
MAAIVFLDVNGVEFNATDEDFTEMVLQVASGKMAKPAITEFLKNHCSQMRPQ